MDGELWTVNPKLQTANRIPHLARELVPGVLRLLNPVPRTFHFPLWLALTLEMGKLKQVWGGINAWMQSWRRLRRSI